MSSSAERMRRLRAHRRGDHGACLPGRCSAAPPAVTESADHGCGDAPEPAPAPPELPQLLPGAAQIELGGRGRQLWQDLATGLASPAHRLLLEETCRLADRLDQLDEVLRGRGRPWLTFEPAEGTAEVVVKIDSALAEARQHASVLRTLVADLVKAAPHRGRPARAATQVKGGGGLADLTARLADRRR